MRHNKHRGSRTGVRVQEGDEGEGGERMEVRPSAGGEQENKKKMEGQSYHNHRGLRKRNGDRKEEREMNSPEKKRCKKVGQLLQVL